jgi:predicted acylesterase/phospholipase RssA
MDGPKKVAIGCQGGGMHAAFEVGVLIEILKDIRENETLKDARDNKRFELVGLSGTSAGALCPALRMKRSTSSTTSGRTSLPEPAPRLR